MKNNQPRRNKEAKVASLIPAWNPGDRLITTIRSITSQPVACEIFVVDDGSEPAIELPEQMNGKPIHLIRQEPNQGISAALNSGLKIILNQSFEFLARHDCGDIDHKNRISSQLTYLSQHQDVMLVGSSVKFNTPNGRLQYVFEARPTKAQIKHKMHYSAAIVHSSCMFRAAAFERVGLYSERYPYAEDYDLFFRLMANHEIRNLPETLVTASYDKGSSSIRNRRISLTSRLQLQLKYFDPLSIHGYLGILQTIGLYILPYRLVCLVKSTSFAVRRA